MEYKTPVINGTTYAYIDTAFWNSSKKRGEHKRKYIGKILDGVFIPNKRFQLEQQVESSAPKRGPVPAESCTRKFYGATFLFDQIAEELGIAADLKSCFGPLASKILSVAYYLISEEGQPMYRFQKWGATHKHPFNEDIPSQRISELFSKISEEKKLEYFRKQSKRRSEKEYLAFDTTSISSYSELLKQVKYGKNKEEELRSGHRNPEHEKAYARYFELHETPARGLKISYKEDAIRQAERDYGYFVLMTNGIKDPVEALRTYRLRDLIEKSLGNLKERLDMRRMSVSSEENFEGKLFVQFIALKLMSYIKKKMDDHHLYKNYTMQQLIDTLDIIELYQQPGKAHHLSEIIEKQLKLYAALGVKAPIWI